MTIPNPSTRTVEVVQQEHNNIAFEAGITNYHIVCLEKKLEKLYEKMLALNEEGAKLMQDQQKEKENGQSINPTTTEAPQGAEVPTAPQSGSDTPISEITPLSH